MKDLLIITGIVKMFDNLTKKIRNLLSKQNHSQQSLKNIEEFADLSQNTSDIVKKFVKINENLDNLVKDKMQELEKVKTKLNIKEEELKRQKELLSNKEKLLSLQNQKLLSQENELTGYINKIFEQQERERIVKWIVNCIRESLDLDTVLSTTVAEIGNLLKVDRCLIALFDNETYKFYLQNEYKKDPEINSFLEEHTEMNVSNEWYKNLVKENQAITVNDVESLPNSRLKDDFRFYNVKSLAIAPVIHKGETLGAIIVHQTQFQRNWGASHIEVLKDISSQISIAIRQASLYTQIQETTRLKSEFLASMSHEFRTPLNAIIGFSEMLASGNYGNLSEKQKEYLGNISISGKHLLRLVNDVLDLSKVESGNMELRYEKFDTEQVIKETISILINMAIKKNLQVNLDLAHIVLNADIGRFRQIMYNLLSNAIKFTEDNGNISLKSSISNNKIKMEIHDTGIGISQKDRNKVFTQFRQLDSSYARKQEGTGLGLTLTKKLIELHKGYIDFDSEEDKGTRFWFVLPEAEIKTANKI